MMIQKNNPPPLYGLLLVGGKSTRMGEDKSALTYRENTPEWQRLATLLQSCCNEYFFCHRAEQDFPENAIIDSGDGPLKAIQAAFTTHQKVAWLVLACDLPLLEIETLEYLVQHRDPYAKATCFKNPVDQLPDPLCAIYEPVISTEIDTALQTGKYCPRSILENSTLLQAPFPNHLINANSKAEQLEVLSKLNNTMSEKTISILYFAKLQDIVKLDQETTTTSSVTASGLYEELKTKYLFPYKQKDLMLAINEEFTAWETPLQENDTVAFIPPVAGG